MEHLQFFFIPITNESHTHFKSCQKKKPFEIKCQHSECDFFVKHFDVDKAAFGGDNYLILSLFFFFFSS